MTRPFTLRLRHPKPLPVEYPEGFERPATRADCRDAVRPCPWAGCRYHLYLDASRFGGVKLNFPDVEPGELEDSCVLDVAERGRHTLEETAAHMNITKERVRQLEARALRRLKAIAPDLVEHLERRD